MHQYEISVVIPVYNAEVTLVSLVNHIAQVLPTLAQRYELILINDGSRDGSLAIIEHLTQVYPWITGIDLMRNYGQHNATIAGIRAARGSVIVTMDADGQHLPEEIHKMLEALQGGHELVYGYAHTSQHEWWRNPINYLTKWIIEKGGFFPDARYLTAFRAFNTSLRDAFEHCQIPYPIVDVLLRWGTGRIGFVATRHAPRQGGKSSSTLANLLTAVMHLVTGHSIVLVRWIELTGLGMATLGLLNIFTGSLALGTIFLSAGLVILSVGAIGEYVARNYHLALGKPQSKIRAHLNKSA